MTADILPPPLYLIELRLVLSQAVEGTLAADKARAEAARLQKEYRECADYWNEHQPYGLEAHLLGAQHDAGQRFIDASLGVLKAVDAGDTAAAQGGTEGRRRALSRAPGRRG